MAITPERKAQMDAVLQSQPTGTLTPDRRAQMDAVLAQSQSPEKHGLLHGIGDLAVGAVKGLGHTVATLGELGAKALSPIDKAFGLKPIQTGATEQALGNLGIKNALTPTNTGQKIGYGAEQVGEFLIPGGAATKGAKATEGLLGGLKLAEKGASLARGVGLGEKLGAGLLEGGAKLATRAGFEGGAGAATALSQGDKPGGAFAAGAAISALPLLGKPLGALVKKIPETAWSSILKRTPSMVAKRPALAREIAETGMVGATRSSLVKQAEHEIQKAEVVLDDLLSKATGKIDTKKVASYLDDLKVAYSSIPGEQSSLETINGIAKDVLSRGDLTPLEANQLKRQIYSLISKTYGKGMLEIPAKREAQKMIAAGLKREIEKVIPEAKGLNEKQAIFINVKKAIEAALARSEGKGIAGSGVGLYDLIIGGGGTLAGTATGNPFAGAMLLGGKKLAESPLVLSGTAKLIQYFDNLSPTKKMLFYNALRGLTGKASSEASKQ